MNKKIAIVVVTVVSASLLAIIAFSGNDKAANNSSQNTSSSGSTSTTSNDSPLLNERENLDQPVETTSVAIRDFAFSPEKIVVKKGTTVTWTNEDQARHDVTPDNPSEAFMGSELLAQGESYSFTFNKTGTFTYICSPHPYMTASVEVIE